MIDKIRAGDIVRYNNKNYKVLVEVNDDVVYLFARPGIQVEKSQLQFLRRGWSPSASTRCASQ